MGTPMAFRLAGFVVPWLGAAPRPELKFRSGAGRDIVISSPSNPHVVAGGAGRRSVRHWLRRALLPMASHRVAALALALVVSGTVVTPALGADGQALGGEARAAATTADVVAPRIVAQQGTGEPDRKDAFDGGFLPPARQIVFPSVEIGLSPQRPIPIGVTCSCTIDRVGLTSQFDITVIEVVQDAYAMVQQLNRFNRPPREGARYVAAYVGQQYIAGPENQAYTGTESDWKSTANDGRLSDTAQLLHTEAEYRPRADVFPRNYVNGWLIYELPVNRPAYLVWNYNFVGERGIWFALQ
ncbi:MAG TPA: hypothetical protein VFH48_26965 [Chloroflexota bacterium]|nr:hypothetical protein [Chloroflexota bacterium]